MSSTSSSASAGNEISLLCQAVKDGDSKKVRRRLSKLIGDDVNQRSGLDLMTPLMYALYEGHLHIARLLMREGADVTLKDSRGYNLIYFSIDTKQVAVILWAIEQGAAKGVGVNDQTDLGMTPVMLSVKDGTIDICNILLSKGSDPSTKGRG